MRRYPSIEKGNDMRIIVEKDNGNWAIYEEHRNEPIYTDGKKENTLRVAKYINETKGYDLVVIN